jgi:hypothetical protein
MDELTGIANFRVLTAGGLFARRLRRYRLLLAVALLLVSGAVGAAGVLLSRPAEITRSVAETRSRDIVLCLDVSGSMTAFDAQTLDTFGTLVDSLAGERIALVLFDGSPLQVFPLTTDYGFVHTQLRTVAGQLRAGVTPVGTTTGGGLSLVGDGIAGCLLQFGSATSGPPEPARSRTVILATDYRTVGTPLVDTASATALAVDRGIVIDGLAPAHRPGAPASVAFEADVVATGGGYFAVAGDPSSAVSAIVAGVTADPATAVTAAPVLLRTETPDLAIWLLGGLVLVVFGFLAVLRI